MREEIPSDKTSPFRHGKIARAVYWTLLAATAVTAVVSIILGCVGRADLTVTVKRVLLCVLCAALFAVPPLSERVFKVFVPDALTVVFVAFLFVHYVPGEILRVYDHSVIFDKALHTISGALYSFVGVSLAFILGRVKPEKASPFFFALFAFCIGLATEYVWELVEFSADRIMGTNMQRWQDGMTRLDSGGFTSEVAYGNGLKDTIVDMAVNIAGALAGSAIIAIMLKRDPRSLYKFIVVPRSLADEITRDEGENKNSGISDPYIKENTSLPCGTCDENGGTGKNRKQ